MIPWLLDITLRMDPPTTTHQNKKLGWGRRAGKAGQRPRPFPVLRDDPRLKAACARYAQALLRHPKRPKSPIDGYVEIELWFVWAWPAGSKHTEEQWRTDTPDWDNAAKTLQDVLVKTGYVLHDNQIVRGTVNKLNGPTPGVVIKLRRLPDFQEWEL